MEERTIASGTAGPSRTSHGQSTGNAASSGHNAAGIAGHQRTPSAGLLSKLSFLRASAEDNHAQPITDYGLLSPEFTPGDDRALPRKSGRAMAVAVQQSKNRRRKGSLRKAALLGRGAQREKPDVMLDTSLPRRHGANNDASPISQEEGQTYAGSKTDAGDLALGTKAADQENATLPRVTTLPMGTQDHVVSPTLTYTSTTDEEDHLHMPVIPPLNDSYFPSPPPPQSLTRRRSSNKPPRSPSPLSGLGILAPTPLPVPSADWDYSETERWGWIILIVTWVVFVTGMGSCLGVWSWAWDVGETPYAPPELEDDPTLPIVGYYPALIILTAVMAWVWVVVAWVGMKYFRHARISGD